ncbi:hypothetical protein KSS87_011191, partial [Heliosperma pusillum]
AVNNRLASFILFGTHRRPPFLKINSRFSFYFADRKTVQAVPSIVTTDIIALIFVDSTTKVKCVFYFTLMSVYFCKH